MVVDNARLKFIRYCAVGVINTGVDFGMFFFLSILGFPLLPSQCIAYFCGFLNSFFLNRKWTFQSYGPSGRQLIRFLGLNLFVLTLTYGMLAWFHYELQWPILVSKIAATLLCTGVSYLGSRLWVFCNPATSM